MSLVSLSRRLCVAAAILPFLATAAGAVCIPAVFPATYLQDQENAGGHTIARHVGKTDVQLVARLNADPNIARASSYGPAAAAQADIIAALTANSAAINAWANAAGVATRDWNANAGHVTGRVASRPAGLGNIANTNNLKVVIRRTGLNACFLLTSYPIP